MNVSCSLDKAPEYGFDGGSKTCDLLRKLYHAEVPKDAINKAIEGESYLSKQAGGKQVYSCLGERSKTRNVDPLCQQHFSTQREYYNHIFELYKAQKAQCLLSKILFLDCNACNYHPFKPSVDAIKPELGHVPGNLRIVAAFLNGANHDKKKKKDPNDPPTSWTKELYEFYINADAGETVPTTTTTSSKGGQGR